jgi:hypothetical protein
MLSSRLLRDMYVSRVSQIREYNRGVKGSMLSSRLLNDVFVYRVSQIREYKRGVNGSILSSRLLNDVLLWFDSHGTRTHHLTDARRA